MINLVNNDETQGFSFQFHHSAGDSMTVLNPYVMDSNVVGIASMFFILDDLDQTIPNAQLT